MEPGVEISDLCRQEGVNPTIYYQWKRQLVGAAEDLCAEGAPAVGPGATAARDGSISGIGDDAWQT